MKTGGTYIPADKEVANKLKEIAQRLTEIVEKLYPSPVKEISLDVPFSEHDVLTIELGRPVAMLPIFTLSFFNVASVYLHRHVLETVEVEFAHGKVHRALFIGGGSAWFEEFRDVVVFVHMLLPEVFRAVKSGRIYSVKGRAEKWFREFISAVEYVSQLDEVKYVRPQDLLNSAFRTEIFVVTIGIS